MSLMRKLVIITNKIQSHSLGAAYRGWKLLRFEVFIISIKIIVSIQVLGMSEGY